MGLSQIGLPVACVVLLAGSYRAYGWAGVAIAAGALVMWLLLHFTRMVQVLQRAAQRPVGHVDSAVMLNARLQPHMRLLHVVAMTRALGQLQSPKGVQPEVYHWCDATQSHVHCEFVGGKLKQWRLVRPDPADGMGAAAVVSTAP